MTSERPIRGVIVDLDDTLYPQAAFLAVAWDAVAAAAAVHGVPAGPFTEALHEIAAQGSGRGRIVDRALERVGRTDVPLEPLLAAFRRAAPGSLPMYDGAREALAALRARVPVAVVTDGEVGGQQAKIRALGLDGAFDAVVLSDSLGREWRKPHPRPFREALLALGVFPEDAVVIGDRPDKDVLGADRAGMRSVRVRTGEYAAAPDLPTPWRSAPTFVEAVTLVTPLLPPPPRPVGAGCGDDARAHGRARRPARATAT